MPALRTSLAVIALCGLLAACGAPRPLPQEQRHTRSSTMQPLPRPQAYRVVRGDTLYSIAFRYGLDWRELAHWNNIGPPYTIRVDQWVRLMPPPTMQAAVARRPATTTGGGQGRQAGSPSPSGEPSTAGTGSSPDPERAEQPSPSSQPAPVPARQQPTPTEPRPVPESAVDAGRAVEVPATTRSVAGVSWGWPSEGRVMRGFDASAARKGILISGSEGQPVRAAAEGEVVYSGSGLIGYGELIIVKHSDRMLSAYGHNRERLVSEGERVRAGELIARMGRNEADEQVLHFEIRRDGRPENPTNFLPPR